MKKNYLSKTVFFVCVTVTAVTCVILSFLLVVGYDAALKLVAADLPGWVIPSLYALFGGFALFTVITIPLFPKNGGQTPEPSPILPTVGSAIMIAAALLFCLSAVFSFFPDDRIGELMLKSTSDSRSIVFASYLAKFGAYLAVVAIAYPCLLIITKKSNAAFAMLASLWMLALALCVYFDIETPMNDPVRLIRIVGCSASAAALLTEARAGLGKLTKKFALTFTSFLLPLVLAPAVSTLVLYVCGIYPIDTWLFASAAMLGIGIITLSRLGSAAFAKDGESA